MGNTREEMNGHVGQKIGVCRRDYWEDSALRSVLLCPQRQSNQNAAETSSVSAFPLVFVLTQRGAGSPPQQSVRAVSCLIVPPSKEAAKQKNQSTRRSEAKADIDDPAPQERIERGKRTVFRRPRAELKTDEDHRGLP